VPKSGPMKSSRRSEPAAWAKSTGPVTPSWTAKSLWSPGQVANRGPWRNFDLTPDGKRFAVTYRQPSQEPAEMKNDKFVVLLDVFNELCRVASPASK
jgi:hypothetical protein